jgi:hypothetical protein
VPRTASLKPKPREEETPAAPEWKEYKSALGGAFAAKVRRRSELAAALKELEQEKDALNAEILLGMKQIPETSVMVDDIRVTYVSQTRKSIDGVRLLELGVPEQTIADATKETYSEFVRVSAPKES